MKIFVTLFSGIVRPKRLKLGTHVIRLLLLIHPFISSFFFLSNFQTLKYFVTIFTGTVRPRRLKLGTHVDSGQMYRIYQNQAAALIHPFIHFSFSPILKHWNFLSHFSQELWGLEGWNMVHTRTVGRCIVYTGIGLLLLFIPLFFFLPNVETLKIFVILFSGTVRPRRWKLATHVDNWWMYYVYWNQAAASYLFLNFFIFLSNFQTLIFFVTLFSGTVRHRRLRLYTHVDNEWMYRVYWNQAAAICCLFYFFIFLPNFQALKIFITFFSGTVKPTRLKLGTHVDNGWMYYVYQNQAAAASIHPFICLSLSFHFFLFLHFSVCNMSFSSDSAIAGL